VEGDLQHNIEECQDLHEDEFMTKFFVAMDVVKKKRHQPFNSQKSHIPDLWLLFTILSVVVLTIESLGAFGDEGNDL
jgi:hypothetical protein